MNEEKLNVLKKGRLLSGSGIFLAEDLSREDRKKRKVQVREMKKARNEGKKAYIRYIDGELIIDGKVYEVDAEGTNPITFPAPAGDNASHQM